MIAHLRGTLLEKKPNLALLDVGGVGYAVTIPVSTFSQLGDPGEQTSLHTFTYVREDTLALFGFFTRGEKELFERLITVNGIGPRLAVTILSGVPTEELVTAIRAGDAKRLTRVPGVGRKGSERIVLELREKLGPLAPEGDTVAAPTSDAGVEQDVISALQNLGCTRDAAQAAVRKALEAGIEHDFEPLFRRSMELVGR
jgi:Holliday junction DNA helicase RuvA